MSIRWLVPSSAASARRLFSAPPWRAMWSIAAARSFSRALASIMNQMVHVPDGSQYFGPRTDVRVRRNLVRPASRRRELAALVAAGVVRAGPGGCRRAGGPGRAAALPDERVLLLRRDRRARAGPPLRLRAGPRPAATGLRRLRRSRAG